MDSQQTNFFISITKDTFTMKNGETKELTALKYTDIRKYFCTRYAKGIRVDIIYNELRLKFYLERPWLYRIVNAPKSERITGNHKSEGLP